MSRPTPTPRLGEILVGEGLLGADDIEEALTAHSPERLGERLVRAGRLDSEALARSLARQLGLEYLPPPLTTDAEAAAVIRPDLLRDRGALPLAVTGRRLRLAVVDPLDAELVAEVRFRSGMHVEPVVVSAEAIEAAGATTPEGERERLLAALPRADGDDDTELVGLARSAPVVRVVDRILGEAVGHSASDVHIEGMGDHVRVRYRIDGVLRTRLTLPAESHRPILSRIKVLSGMDIAVRRRPQDGGFTLRGGREVRVRASTLPLAAGEKAVLRLLDPSGAPRSLDELGFSSRDLATVRRLGMAGQGVVLAAGPTGSGKTSSLFAALAEVNQEWLNVVTLEDPVEYRLPGINQVHVNARAGLTFPAALRSVLRQDPDIVMIGEIRDRETAEIAMTAAVTGHLVLSTIHTIDAPGAVTRLLDMGVPPFLVAGGLSGVVAQRLVRTVCRHCDARDPECPHCPDGYAGRTGVFQVLALNDAMRDEITGEASAAALRRLARESGMATLAEDARRKIAERLTTPQEVTRVVQGDPGAALPCARCERDVPSGAPACPWCGQVRRTECACGAPLRPGWRYCPECVRPVSAARPPAAVA